MSVRGNLFSWWDRRSCEASRGAARIPWPWVWGKRCCWSACRCPAVRRCRLANLAANWPSVEAEAAEPVDAADWSPALAEAGAAVVASHAPILASERPICSPRGSGRMRPTCKAEAFQVATKVAVLDDRDERCNYREGPVRDPEVGNETRRTVSVGRTCPGGRKGSARSALRPPTVVVHLSPSTDCTDAPAARPSLVSAIWPVDSETRPVTKHFYTIHSLLFFLDLYFYARPFIRKREKGGFLFETMVFLAKGDPGSRYTYFQNTVRWFIDGFREEKTRAAIQESISSPFSGNYPFDSGVGREIVFRSLEVVGQPWKCEFRLNWRILPFSGNKRGVLLLVTLKGNQRSLTARGSSVLPFFPLHFSSSAYLWTFAFLLENLWNISRRKIVSRYSLMAYICLSNEIVSFDEILK